MTHTIDLPIGTAGLVLADIDPHLYFGAEAVGIGAAALDPIGDGTDYALAGLPDGVNEAPWTLTYEYPEGVGFAFYWGGPTAPEAVILPIREAGLAGSLDLSLYREGVEWGGSLVAVELDRDYAVSGWPRPTPGERWTLVWRVAGISFFRSWLQPGTPAEGLAPETTVRRLLGSYWLRNWLGEALDQKTFCPAGVIGSPGLEAEFDLEEEAHTAPFTPAEAKATGYVAMRVYELDRFDDGLAAGGTSAASVESRDEVLYSLDFELAAPSKMVGADPIALLETRAYEVERLFRGLAIRPSDSAVLSIRNLSRYPTRRRGGSDDGTWRRARLTVPVVARIRQTHIGEQEVALP